MKTKVVMAVALVSSVAGCEGLFLARNSPNGNGGNGTVTNSANQTSVGDHLARPFCAPCANDKQCGAGNYCLRNDDETASFCGAACDGDLVCEAGSTCVGVLDDDGNIIAKNCFPLIGTCSTTSGAACANTWSNYAEAFVANSCLGCHAWANDYDQVRDRASEIKTRVVTGQMPPGGGLITADIDRIDLWIDCGMPK